MKKTILYIVLLAAVAGGAWYVLKDPDTQLFSSKDSAFGIRDTAVIGKVFLADMRGNTVLLTRSDSGWTLDNKYAANMFSVRTLLETIYKQEPVNAVPENGRDAVVRSMAGNATKVEIYNRGGEKMRTFYVGGEVREGMGSYMLMEGSQRPYIVNIPGFQGYLGPRYSLRKEGWRDKGVFRYNPASIERISVQYGEKPINSFVVTRKVQGADTVYLVNTDSSLGYQPEKALQAKTKFYTTFYQNINLEGWASGISDMDSTLREMPLFAAMEVTAGNKTDKLLVYYSPLNRRSKNMDKTLTDFNNDYDAERFYGVMNNGRDTVLIQRLMLIKAFRKGFEFFQ